ncbi:hypothetical protein BC938DRAFT_477999 [Jimgerdemannia flammicorona]|uniref:Uncharacterized protein n=1 Tax=Jimgerdemannia flammicorona TaxID=994334 RepID=A0A433QNJ7_9FUNG|nr:hypothetical protein BC938DRAFT_477999 [Jimgerdemannia flammicorona]
MRSGSYKPTFTFAEYQTLVTEMANLIPNIIFGSHLDVTSTQILGCGISLAVALYLAQRWMDGNKDFDLDYMLRGGKQLDLKLPKLITKHITPNLKAYTPRVVRKLVFDIISNLTINMG